MQTVSVAEMAGQHTHENCTHCAFSNEALVEGVKRKIHQRHIQRVAAEIRSGTESGAAEAKLKARREKAFLKAVGNKGMFPEIFRNTLFSTHSQNTRAWKYIRTVCSLNIPGTV